VTKGERIGLVVGLVCGAPFLTVGLLLIVNNLDASPPHSYLRFLIGGNVIHDAIVAPIALLVGWLVIARFPPSTRAPLRAALFTSAVVIAIAWPGLRQYGRMRTPTNSTVQPLNYARSVGVSLAIVWVIAGVWSALALRRARQVPGGGAT
jgi:hypothetical protein